MNLWARAQTGMGILLKFDGSSADSLSRPFRYLLAIMIFAVALLVRLILGPPQDGLPFITFYPATVVTVLLCGLGPGLVTVGLAAVTISYAFLPPFLSWKLESSQEAVLITFVFCEVLICAIINQMHRARRAACDQSHLTRRLLETIPVPVFFKDAAGIYIACNRAFETFVGLDAKALLGKTAHDVWPKDQADTFKASDDAVFRSLGSESRETKVICADGSTHIVVLGKSILIRADGQCGGLVGVIHDITAMHAAAAELVKAKEIAENANEAKTRFLASVSHDLRQPMMAQRMLLHVAASHAENPVQADILARIAEALDGTERMLSRLLDLAVLELGKMPVKRELFRLDSLLSTIVSENAGTAAAKGLQLRLRTSPCRIDSDPVLLGRILRNLVGNAVRYTYRGRVLIAVRRRGPRVRIEVRDSGVGVPPDQQQIIFEEFHQIGKHGSRTDGQGLGLAIAARTAELLGHPLFLRSAVDRGSTFGVEVPVVAMPADEEDQGAATPSTPPSRPAHILVIEDEPIQATALEMVLIERGYNVSVAPNTATALAARPERFDLIISDYRLGGGVTGIDGIEAIRLASGRRVPALLLTGDTQESVVTAAAVVGCDILHKPCTPSAILEAAVRLIAGFHGTV